MVSAGSKLRASDLNVAAASALVSDSGTTSSTGYTGTRTGTSNVAGCTFIAPNSGNIMVLWGAGISCTAGFILVSFEVNLGGTVGSGTVVQSASDNIQVQGTNTTETSSSTFYPVSGLTAGAQYNARLMYRVNAATTTGTINRPRIAVMPLLA